MNKVILTAPSFLHQHGSPRMGQAVWLIHLEASATTTSFGHSIYWFTLALRVMSVFLVYENSNPKIVLENYTSNFLHIFISSLTWQFTFHSFTRVLFPLQAFCSLKTLWRKRNVCVPGARESCTARTTWTTLRSCLSWQQCLPSWSFFPWYELECCCLLPLWSHCQTFPSMYLPSHFDLNFYLVVVDLLMMPLCSPGHALPAIYFILLFVSILQRCRIIEHLGGSIYISLITSFCVPVCAVGLGKSWF